MGEILRVDFRAVELPDGKVTLLCKEVGNPEWPDQGRLYDGWQQLIGTMSEIFGRPENDFTSLRVGGNALENQRVTEQQLMGFQFPNLKRPPLSAQSILPPDDEI